MDGYRAMHTIQLDDIEPGVLTDTSSWALLYRPLIFPAPGRTQSELIYAKVLPFLNKRPLMASAMTSARSDGAGNATHPLSAAREGRRRERRAARARGCARGGRVLAGRRASARGRARGDGHETRALGVYDAGLGGDSGTRALGRRARRGARVRVPYVVRGRRAARGRARGRRRPGIASPALTPSRRRRSRRPQPPRARSVLGIRSRRRWRHGRRAHVAAAADSVTGRRAGVLSAGRVLRCVEPALLQRVSQLSLQPARLPPPRRGIDAPRERRRPRARRSRTRTRQTSPTPGHAVPGRGVRRRRSSAAWLRTADGGAATAIEALAGESRSRRPIVRPVELTLCARLASNDGGLEASGGDAQGRALLRAAREPERTLLPNTFALRASLLAHLFCAGLARAAAARSTRRAAREVLLGLRRPCATRPRRSCCGVLRLLARSTSAAPRRCRLSATRSFDAARAALDRVASRPSRTRSMRLRVSGPPESRVLRRTTPAPRTAPWPRSGSRWPLRASRRSTSGSTVPERTGAV